MFSIMKRPVIGRGNANVGGSGIGANAGPERNTFGARVPGAGEQSFEIMGVHSWTCRTWRESQKALSALRRTESF